MTPSAHPSWPASNGRRAKPTPARAWLAAACVAMAGCTLTPLAPQLDGVSPGWGYNGENTEIEIAGANFFPTVIVSEKTEAGGRLEGGFEAWLEGEGDPVALEDVRHLSYDRLVAEVPAGIDPGVYDLRVDVPTGLTATLPGAFVVTDTRADHLDLYVNDASYSVGGFAAVTITLQDPTDRIVLQPLEVEVTVEPVDPLTDSVDGVTFYADGLDDQVPLEDGVGIRGKLDQTGSGAVLVTSETSTDVRLVVSAADGGIVRGDSQVLSWDPGDVASVELTFPREPFKTVAGTPFDLTIRFKDVFDNLLTDTAGDVYLRDSCGNQFAQVQVVDGESDVSLTLTTACEENFIYASAFGDNWVSAAFEVLPAPLAGYDVQPLQPWVDAGETLVVVVGAEDEFGNPIRDHALPIKLFDQVGELDPELGVGRHECPAFSNGITVCEAEVWTAGPEVIIRAEDDEDGSGEAEPIEVLPADATSLVVYVDATTVEAGEVFDVSVRALDPYGNSVTFDPAGTEPVVWSDNSRTISCTWEGALDGAQGFLCAISGAVADANVRAEVLGLSVDAADVLTVTNGPLALVELDPLAGTLTAGEAFTLELHGYDAYGNDYIIQTDAVVDLDDTAGTMTPTSAVLGPLGTAQVSAVLYGAGTSVRIYASQGGTRIGVSRPLTVNAAEFDAIQVDAPPWIPIDEPGLVELTAVDAYGNAVQSYAGTLTVSAHGDSCEEIEISTFHQGRARVDLSCPDAALSETLVAVDDAGLTWESATIDIVDLACPDGPTASLELDGLTDAIECLAEGDSVEVLADTSGSTAGGAWISVRHFVDGEAVQQRTPSPTNTLVYETTGTRRVQALVVDSDACADLAEGLVYVGADDGEPTGPIDVSVSDGTATSTADSVTVSFSATDCTGDVASLQDVLIRADIGTPSGTSTGEGLLVSLDASGEGSVTWDFDSGAAGTATVYVGSRGGGGIGSATVLVTGDALLPELVSLDPSGTALGTISSIEAVFTEPMRARNMTSAYISLTGPDGTVPATFDMSSDLETLTITPDDPLDGSAGVYTLTFSLQVRDNLGGNQIDGQWTGSPAELALTFGAVGESLPDVTSCNTTPSTFVPDGDDGAGGEEDRVSLTPTATATPTWWWLVVSDADGARVRSQRQPGVDATIAWDGRDDDGKVAPAGAYRLWVGAIDAYGNVGDACDAQVELEQHVDEP